MLQKQQEHIKWPTLLQSQPFLLQVNIQAKKIHISTCTFSPEAEQIHIMVFYSSNKFPPTDDYNDFSL